MLEGHSIICFGPSDWWAMNPSCTTHIMRRLARTNRVLYVNPFSSDLLGSTGRHRRRGLATRVRRKMHSLTQGLRKAQENLYVFSPLFCPIQGHSFVDGMNNLGLKLQIRRACRRLGLGRPLIWLENMRAVDILASLDVDAVIYHVSDLFAMDKYASNKNRLKAREARATRESDLLICVSRRLYELKRAEAENVHYVPHGVDWDLFRAAAEARRPFPQLRGISRPIAGYFGTMTANNDIEMMTYCAQKLPHVSFVFAGQITGGDYSELGRLPNVHLLGRLPFEDIPSLCAGFDVCLLQWKMSDWIRNCNPLKMLEYMASGNPIVSVEINEAKQYADVISVTRNQEEFCRAIEWELHNDTEDRQKKRLAIAAQHTWGSHVEKIAGLIEEAIRMREARRL